MSSGVNKVILVGRLGQEPELRQTSGGQPVCSLSLATSESWVKDGQKEEKTEWHRVTLWGRQAELAHKYLRKGRMVYIEGKLQTRSWQDPQGQKKYATDIVATSMQFIDGGNSSSSSSPRSGEGYSEPMAPMGESQPAFFSPSAPSSQPSSAPFPGFDEDIPF